MISHRHYYRLKPFVPWRARMMARRIIAGRLRRKHADTWPINELAGTPPANWTGWPDRKEFALVLTHDVENSTGLAKCRQLMQLEQELGFHSSFNFVPEGDYRVSAELRNELKKNGFEVGIHDLHHDGKFYWDESIKENARRINVYLKEWGAEGFRSAFMLHDLGSLQALNVLYDASTFDTDPFEPQPDGVNTIFPFWVPRPGGGGYVELPYTLPQDSTLFLVLRERTNSLWVRKLDWLVQKRGMALVNVHPDYIRFKGEPAGPKTYDMSLYADFLKYIRDRYKGMYWQPLPREIARFAADTQPRLPRQKTRRVCMITHSFYETDNRVTRYAESLAERGDEVDVVALRRNADVPSEETISGVQVYRPQTRKGKNEKTKLDYLWPLIRFLFTSAFWAARSHRKKPYDLIHVHNIPDFMVFAAWYPKWRGAKVILDIHDIVPEFYVSKFGKPQAGVTFKLLQMMERVSAKMANHVILANHLWLEKYTKRSAALKKCTVFINNVDTRVFYPRPRSRNDGKLILLFPGGLQWHQGLDIAIRAFKQVSPLVQNAEFHIYGEGNVKPDLVSLVQQLGLEGKVRFFEPIGIRQIAEVMANADLGVVPKRADSFGNEAYSTKIMEFMSLGVPMVVSSTKIDRYYFNDSVVRFFESGNVEALANALLDLFQNNELRVGLSDLGRNYARANSWGIRKSDYLELVDSLVENRSRMIADSGMPAANIDNVAMPQSETAVAP